MLVKGAPSILHQASKCLFGMLVSEERDIDAARFWISLLDDVASVDRQGCFPLQGGACDFHFCGFWDLFQRALRIFRNFLFCQGNPCGVDYVSRVCYREVHKFIHEFWVRSIWTKQCIPCSADQIRWHVICYRSNKSPLWCSNFWY